MLLWGGVKRLLKKCIFFFSKREKEEKGRNKKWVRK